MAKLPKYARQAAIDTGRKLRKKPPSKRVVQHRKDLKALTTGTTRERINVTGRMRRQMRKK